MKELLRRIPKVDSILRHGKWKDFTGTYPDRVAREALDLVLDELRRDIRSGTRTTVPVIQDIIDSTRLIAERLFKPGLKRVVNGTGVIIHTNLGRSLLCPSAIEGIVTAGSHYTNLEYNLTEGLRGSRYSHCSDILTKITGAEAALVVNNNAAAVYLVLNTLAEGREAIISRGELVEIGGSFRIPDVMKKSGVALKEVGTTNRTYRKDFEDAIWQNTALLMKIHRSNFILKGFTHTPKDEEIVELGKIHNVPTYLDAGSGLLIRLTSIGVHDEPVIPEAVLKGFDMISFSGDKLLGGPQAGIIVGKKHYIDAMKSNPLTRALRPDKFTLAGLENTLLLYLDEERAKEDIPTLKMIHAGLDSLAKQARHLVQLINSRCPGINGTETETLSEVGGGTLPDVKIPSYGIAFKPSSMGVEELDRRLRSSEVPVIGRIEKDHYILDMRTILAEDEHCIMSAFEAALRE